MTWGIHPLLSILDLKLCGPPGNPCSNLLLAVDAPLLLNLWRANQPEYQLRAPGKLEDGTEAASGAHFHNKYQRREKRFGGKKI